MKNITYTIANSVEELHQIIALQRNNLVTSVSQEEREKEGFVTVEHNITILKKMNDLQPHIIARDGDRVVGYALSMVKEFRNEIEILKPMFSKIDTSLDSTNSYITMGQICIDKAYRKQGMFRGLYYKMRDELMNTYDLLITEVAANNLRSLQAHHAVGFETLLVYESNGIEWNLIQWDWK